MPKSKSFCLAFVCLFLFSMAAGCAKQEVVKKDESIAAPSVTKHIEPKTEAGIVKESPKKPEPKASPLPLTASASVQQSQNASSKMPLESALEKIYFNFDSAVLSESARKALTKNADVLMQTKSAVRIEGNCDERGSAEYNLALGERRAKAAQQYLLTLGVDSSRISTVSYGKEKPAVLGGDEAAMAQNRRDEFVVIK